MPESNVSRRAFLLAITGSAAAVAVGCRPQTDAMPTLYAPGSSAPTHTPQVLNPAAPATPDALLGTVTHDKPIFTPVDKLYITQYNYGLTPAVDGSTWKLAVDGLVETPLALSLTDLRALPAHEDVRVLECISNPVGGNLIGNLKWRGVLMDDLLKLAKPKPEATHVRFEAADGYTTSVKREWIEQPNTLLAYEMNGQPLTVAHGFPLRIHMPGLYGQKMPRWLTRLEFIDYDYIGYWESRGWSNIAAIKTKSIIDSPTDGSSAPTGSGIAIQGVAVAGKRKITNVEVQIDGGQWLPATLAPQPDLGWTQWYVTVVLGAPGEYRIGVRATDDTGFVQTAEASGVFGGAFPDGTDSIHRLVVRML
jgi:DMSO/TMAO reductase YedYZ molybdopterin-dependent catalytic subunit